MLIEEYNYHLPEEKIAKFPLENREESKLLVYKNGEISQSQFKNILHFLPENSLLLFNDTKVIPARLLFNKPTGAKIEIFLLEPHSPFQDMQKAMEVKDGCVWKCAIGNKKKWKEGTTLDQFFNADNQTFNLTATIEDRNFDLVRFEWEGPFSFAEVVQQTGKTPIPPYLQREQQEIDAIRYQTVYSHHEGAVAAPTAGLHFTADIIKSLGDKNISYDFVTLHVSAGTFKPVQAENYQDHEMHREQIVVHQSVIKKLLEADQIICVGTTSLRTLESLYWMGVKKLHGLHNFSFVEKLLPYSRTLPAYSKKEALSGLLSYMKENTTETLRGETEIFIFPPYEFKMCEGLITNFHLPKSTLLLLVSAFIGGDWKRVYDFALKHDFRFLSYGDTSLLMK